jgi:hypothetical protein
MSKPRIVKEVDHSITSSAPTWMMWVLSKLNASPEIVWKLVTYSVACLRLDSESVTKRVVLSAKASYLASEMVFPRYSLFSLLVRFRP